jgi:hypothetical protein
MGQSTSGSAAPALATLRCKLEANETARAMMPARSV